MHLSACRLAGLWSREDNRNGTQRQSQRCAFKKLDLFVLLLITFLFTVAY